MWSWALHTLRHPGESNGTDSCLLHAWVSKSLLFHLTGGVSLVGRSAWKEHVIPTWDIFEISMPCRPIWVKCFSHRPRPFYNSSFDSGEQWKHRSDPKWPLKVCYGDKETHASKWDTVSLNNNISALHHAGGGKIKHNNGAYESYFVH